MALLDLLGIRKELKTRTNQILKASENWCTHADELTKALNKVSKKIDEGGVDSATKKKIQTSTRALSKDTRRLTTALGRHQNAMGRLGEALSDG